MEVSWRAREHRRTSSTATADRRWDGVSEDARAVERFTAVLGASDIPSLLVLDDRVVAANDAALGLFGAAPTGRSGRSPSASTTRPGPS